MAKVELFSSHAMRVYKELSFVDKSLDIEKAKIVATQQLMRVQPTFTSTVVKIKKGQGLYDAAILDWPTIKSFVKQGVIRILSPEYVMHYAKQEEEVKEEPKDETPSGTGDKKAPGGKRTGKTVAGGLAGAVPE